MDLDVWPKPGGAPHRGEARWNGLLLPCALGRAGIRADKKEGDNATPAGRFALRRALFRADRIAQPATRLPLQEIGADDGWCDDAADPAYNRQVRLPYPARHERLWRDDAIYDLIVVIGHNDDPVVPGAGSAIFLHVARPDWSGTEGCVAFRLEHLRRIVEECDTQGCARIHRRPR